MNDNWTFIATILTGITQAVQAGGDQLLNGAVGYARPIVIAGSVAWIAAQAIAVSYANAPIRTLYNGLFVIAAVIAALQSTGTYNEYVGNLALALPNEISNALGGAAAGIADGQAFDKVLNTAIKAGARVWAHIGQYSLKGAFLTLAVIGYWGASIICVGGAALVYGASTMLLIILVKCGAFGVALYAFPQTRRIANGWLTGVGSSILTQVFAVAILLLLIAALQVRMPQIAAAAGDKDPNSVEGVIMLMEVAVMLWFVWSLVKQAPGIATGIAGGIYQRMDNFTRAAEMAPAMVGNAVRGAANVAGSGIQGTANAARKVSSSINQRRVNAAINQ